MLLRYYTVVDRPFVETEAAFLKGAENWMPDLAFKANGHGVALLSELGFKVGERRIARRIEMKLGKPLRAPGLTLLPIRWRAATNAGFFPALDGEIEVAALGGSATQVTLSASYEPPLGLMGKLVDRGLLHRIAEVTVKDFVERVGARLKD